MYRVRPEEKALAYSYHSKHLHGFNPEDTVVSGVSSQLMEMSVS
jgi:hypothetical protein